MDLSENVVIKWEKDGEVVNKEKFSSMEKDEAIISNLTVYINSESDFGKFRCIAENVVGTSYKEINLNKQGIQESFTLFCVEWSFLYFLLCL